MNFFYFFNIIWRTSTKCCLKKYLTIHCFVPLKLKKKISSLLHVDPLFFIFRFWMKWKEKSFIFLVNCFLRDIWGDMKSSRPQSSVRIHTRLEAFLAKQLNLDHVEFYEQESCIQDNEKSKLLGKFKYCILIVCNDRIYLTDNPPKNLDNYILYEDILEIKMVNFNLLTFNSQLKDAQSP